MKKNTKPLHWKPIRVEELIHARIQKVLPEGVQVLVDEGIEDPNSTKSEPLLIRQRNAISMAFRWWADNGPTLNAGWLGSFLIFQGIRTRITNYPYIL